jgi:hypothetical protein
VRVSMELLVQCLSLPDDTDIRLVSTSEDGRYAVLILSHADLKDAELHTGELYPSALPTFTRDANGVVAFVGWGQS